MIAENTRILGRTGLKVGRLGVSASYGAPTRSFEEAFEKSCNYFYWGSMRMCMEKNKGVNGIT